MWSRLMDAFLSALASRAAEWVWGQVTPFLAGREETLE